MATHDLPSSSGDAHDADVLNERQKKVLVTAGIVGLALILPATLAVVGARQMWRESRVPQPTPGSNTALKEAAERAADAALPVPTLAADALVVECGPNELEAQVQRVVRLSTGVGGVASSWNDGSTIRIIAKIPTDAESVFRDAIARGIYDMQIAKGSATTTIVEVLIKPGAKVSGKGSRKQ